jgi:spore maturation protein CgeB
MRRTTLERLGHETVPVDYMLIVLSYWLLARKIQWRLRAGPMVERYNRLLFERLEQRFDILWVEKGIFVHPEIIACARRNGVRTVLYSPDNYFLAQNASRHLWGALPLYDLVVTTKSDKVEFLKAAGARAVLLSGNAYDPETHRPISEDDPGQQEYACDISFVGRWEPEREAWLERIAETGVKLSIRGFQWERARSTAVRQATHAGPALGLDYARAISAAKINLAFLSRLAGDAITQRSVEIPACGGFMLAERTEEHLAHFAEGVEVAYFDGIEDLLGKISFYLPRADERRRIADAGRARCLTSGYSYDARLTHILETVELQR